VNNVNRFTYGFNDELAFVQRILRVGLKEKVLQSHHNRVEVKNRLPIFAKDVQAYVALKVNIWMIDLNYYGYLII
jgi:hypothetical protein